ncbi:MAG: hypothetical protein NUV77_23250 [Thermoguttaceae bacterium]|nr:hypothetical protein [Thermoguttaceae bacterium]
MNVLRLQIVRVAGPMAIVGLLWSGSASAWSPAETHGLLRTIEVTSGRCPATDATRARQEAEAKVQDELLVAFGGLAQEVSGRTLSREELVLERAWLLEQPGVQCQKQTAEETRQYGPVAQATVTVAVPEAVLARWALRLAEQHRRRQGWLSGGVLATAGLWLAGLALWVKLDRARGGYYRKRLALAMLVGLVLATVLGWVWLVGWAEQAARWWLSSNG